MNYAELNSILYYADYISLKQECKPVTDVCKYFFVHGFPINIRFLDNGRPEYDENNKYFIEAYTLYNKIKDQFGEDEAQSFIDDLCYIRATGVVDAEQMLKFIHIYSSKQDRRDAISRYNRWKNSKKYTHIVLNDQGDPIEQECTIYVKHAEEKQHNKASRQQGRD